MSDINTIRTAIQAKMAAITGIVYAPVLMPAQLDEADMPISLVFAGPGVSRHQTFGDAGEQQQRTMLIRVYVSPDVQGAPGEKYELAEVILQRVVNAWLDDQTMEAQAGIVLVAGEPVTDTGIVTADQGGMMFGGVAYMGFQVSLPVQWWEGG